LLVAFLGYALWVTLQHRLESKTLDRSPAQALAIASSLHSTDIVLRMIAKFVSGASHPHRRAARLV
jgi:hypothetical protein